MENPNTWGEPERVVQKVLDDYYADTSKMIVGLSLSLRITNALREAGLLEEETE